MNESKRHWAHSSALQAQRRHEEGAAAAANSVVSSLGALGSVSSVDSLNSSQSASATSNGAPLSHTASHTLAADLLLVPARSAAAGDTWSSQQHPKAQQKHNKRCLWVVRCWQPESLLSLTIRL